MQRPGGGCEARSLGYKRLRDEQEPGCKKPCKTTSRSLGFILRAIRSQKGFKASQWHDNICVLECSPWCNCEEKSGGTGTGEGDGRRKGSGKETPSGLISAPWPPSLDLGWPGYDSDICKSNTNGYRF